MNLGGTNGWDTEANLVGDSGQFTRAGVGARLFDAVRTVERTSERDLVRNEELGREIRVFFTHDFSINGIDVGDTLRSYFRCDQTLQGRVRFLIKGQVAVRAFINMPPGRRGFGKRRHLAGAEDGVLEGNPVAQVPSIQRSAFGSKWGPGRKS